MLSKNMGIYTTTDNKSFCATETSFHTVAQTLLSVQTVQDNFVQHITNTDTEARFRAVAQTLLSFIS